MKQPETTYVMNVNEKKNQMKHVAQKMEIVQETNNAYGIVAFKMAVNLRILAIFSWLLGISALMC